MAAAAPAAPGWTRREAAAAARQAAEVRRAHHDQADANRCGLDDPPPRAGSGSSAAGRAATPTTAVNDRQLRKDVAEEPLAPDRPVRLARWTTRPQPHRESRKWPSQPRPLRRTSSRRRGVSNCGGASLSAQTRSSRDDRLGAVGQEQGEHQRQRPPGRQLDGEVHRQHRQQHQPPPARRHEQQSRRQDGVGWPDDRRRGRRQRAAAGRECCRSNSRRRRQGRWRRLQGVVSSPVLSARSLLPARAYQFFSLRLRYSTFIGGPT